MSNNETVAVDIPSATDPIMERDNHVITIRTERNAVGYLRRKDCEMVATLKAHLAENIRLNGILRDIQNEIAHFKKLLQTPKPKFKIFLFILGTILALVSILMVMGSSSIGSLGANTTSIVQWIPLIIGLAFITTAIVKKVVGNKKWQKFIDETKAQLADAEHRAELAQKDINEYWENHAVPYITSIIPDKFPSDSVLNYRTVCGVLDLMENLRADNVKEAINLYEEMAFRDSMQAAFQSMDVSLRQTARNSERTAAAAERSAAANESAALSAAATAASMASVASSARRASNASVRASDASVEASNAIRDMANRQ